LRTLKSFPSNKSIFRLNLFSYLLWLEVTIFFYGHRWWWLLATVTHDSDKLDIDIRQLEAADLLARILMETTSFSKTLRESS
jgi:hypothetical protein